MSQEQHAPDNPASRKQTGHGADARPCPEYECASCSRSMVVLVGEAPDEPRCHRCRMLPGWHKRSEVVALCELDEQLIAPATAGSAEGGRA